MKHLLLLTIPILLLQPLVGTAIFVDIGEYKEAEKTRMIETPTLSHLTLPGLNLTLATIIRSTTRKTVTLEYGDEARIRRGCFACLFKSGFHTT